MSATPNHFRPTAPGSTARPVAIVLGLLGLFVWTSCNGDDGAPGRAGIDGTGVVPPPLSRSDSLPGFELTILKVEGGSGPGGNLRVGDRPLVTFRAREATGAQALIPKAKWGFAELLFAGPASNYQQVAAYRTVADNSIQNADGTWTFTFPDVIPALVPNQINQENTIPYASGTLAGQALPDGTYTIGMSMRQDFVIEGTEFHDATSTTFDLLVGSATQISKRELVTDANCEKCHTTLRAHGGNRFGVATCVLCHTNGAEDLNNPNAVAGTTPGLSISFQTMIHKVHSGVHLPSVNGKTVDATTGLPIYGTGTPYVVVRSRGEFDFSHVAFPQWPHLLTGMPRDIGYTLPNGDPNPAVNTSAENAILAGPTNCLTCHGDPDGATGPLPAPADGDTIFSNAITTRACIACHDDWDPSKPYTANGSTMPAGLSDASCTDCHGENPGNPNAAVNVRKAHTHPLLDTSDPPLWGPGAGAKGLQFNVQSVREPGGGNGLLEAGDKVEVAVEIVDRNGAVIPAADIKRMEIVVTGPSENPNLLYVTSYSNSNGSSPVPVLGAGPVHTFTLKDRIPYELAAATGNASQFRTALTPIQPALFGAAEVYTVPTGVASGVILTAAAQPFQNYVDVNNAATLALNANDIVVIDEAFASIEYLQVKKVEGNRIWFAAPLDTIAIRLGKTHEIGAEVVKVAPVEDVGATIFDAANGVVQLSAAPAVGENVLVTYTTDFVIPTTYTGAINNSPSKDPNDKRVDATIGEWTGRMLVPGTYQIGVYGEVGFAVEVSGGGQTQTTSYTEGAEGDTVLAFRLGTAGDLDVIDRISSASNCYSCHRDLQFHGSHRRGFDNCMLCHGSSGAEDWPAWKSPNVDMLQSPGVSIEFREMIHKIHRGHELDAGADYQVAGFSGREHSYEHVGFPSFLGGTANCASCHGSENKAWHAPTLRLHPDESRFAPHLEWRMVCGSCHDDRTAFAHMLSNSGGDVESCAVCHGAGTELDVELVHNHWVR